MMIIVNLLNDSTLTTNNVINNSLMYFDCKKLCGFMQYLSNFFVVVVILSSMDVE